MDTRALAVAWPYLLGTFVAAYFVGSIPFGLILARLAGHGDIRRIGSGGIGATNVLRTGNKWIAALTLLLDAAKGTVAVLAAAAFTPTVGPAAIGALLGHMFSPWLRFRGGKGVAAGLGVLLGMAWPIALVGIATWIATVVITRISSAGALAVAVVSPAAAWLAWAYAEWGVVKHHAETILVLAVFVFWAHRANIHRLLTGTEARIGDSHANAAAPDAKGHPGGGADGHD